MKIVAATKNMGKLSEIKDIFTEAEIISMVEAGADFDVVEDGASFEENAVKKALEVGRATGLPTLADDSGLSVDALGGAPGVYSARYAENDVERIARLLSELSGILARRARFISVCAIYIPEKGIITAEGESEGEIALSPKGENGFGYDSVFYVPEIGKTYGELSAREKNERSHRARALAALREKLKERKLL